MAEMREKRLAEENKRLEEREIERNKYRSVIEASRKQVEENKANLERLDGTLASIDKSKQSIDEVNQKFQHFKDTAEEVFRNCLRGFADQAVS